MPGDDVIKALKSVPGVTVVTAEGNRGYRVQGEGDLRAAVAQAAVPFGLLELNARRRLEDVFLQLTQREGE